MGRIAALSASLFICLIGSALAQTPSERPPDAAAVTYADCHGLDAYGSKVCLWRCANKGTIITCNLAYYRGRGDVYTGTALGNSTATLVDNFRISHAMAKATWINGRGQPQTTTSIGKGDWVWSAIQFKDGANDITSARIVVTNPDYSLSGPVEAVQ